MRTLSRLIFSGLPVLLLAAILGRPASAAETLLYDVSSVEFGASTAPMLGSTAPVRIEVTDSGPGSSPRWRSNTGPFDFVVWDAAPPDLSTPDLHVFGNHCAEMGRVLSDGAVPRTVQDEFGGGNFAWLPSRAFTPDGALDPYAFFCLKSSHQSTTAWTERILIGRRVSAAQPPPSAQQVTIALAPNQTLRGSAPIKISASGFATGPLKYFISIDDNQKWFWNTSATTITQWWGTTAYPNGTHTVTVRVTDSTGKTATSSVTVLVRN